MRILNALFVIVLLLVSSVDVQAAEKNEEVLKIGSILVLTGQGSAWGAASRNGIEMALERINAEGGLLGKKVECVYQDIQGDPKKSVLAFHELVSLEGIKMIIGPTWSTHGIPLIERAHKQKVLMISASVGLAKFNESSKFIFNTWPHDYVLSQNLADYVFNKGHRRVAVTGAEDIWVKEQTRVFSRRFKELGGEILFTTEPLPDNTDLKTIALRIKNLPNLDAIVSTSDGAVVGSLVAKALKELNVRLPMFSVTLDQIAIDTAQGGFENAVFLTSLTPDPEFQKEYEQRYKTTIDISADGSYDAVMMLAEAIKKTQTTDTEVLADYLNGIKTYDGVSGDLVSDGKGGFVKDFAIKRIVNGKPVDVNDS